MSPHRRPIEALLLSLALAAAAPAASQAPSLNACRPAALAPGRVTVVTLHGERLAGAAALWASFPAEAAPAAEGAGGDAARAAFAITIPAGTPPGIGALRVAAPGGISNLALVIIADQPAASERGDNSSMASAQMLAIPGAVDGACDALAVDWYGFTARAGQRVWIDAVARRLGSPLDPVIRLVDERGRELAYADDTPGIGPDCALMFEAPADGRYFIELRDIEYHGGPEHRYRLRAGTEPPPALALAEPPGPFPEVAETEPNDLPEGAGAVPIPASIRGTFEKPGDRDHFALEVEKGDRLLFRGRTRSLGSPCDLYMELLDAGGARLALARPDDGGEGVIDQVFSAGGACRLRVEELAGRGGPDLRYRIDIDRYRPGFSLAAAADRVSAPEGGSFKLAVHCARRDFKGPIELQVELADEPAAGAGGAFKVLEGVIPEGGDEVQLEAALPPGLHAGAARAITVTGRAMVAGREFRARASTLEILLRQFPLLPYSLASLDGLIGLGVRPAAAPPEPAGSTGGGD